VREDLVDHGPLRDERHDPQGAVAGRAHEGVDLEDLRQERRPPVRLTSLFESIYLPLADSASSEPAVHYVARPCGRRE